jgi:hypothetical protein
MFLNLTEAWIEMLKNCTHIADDEGVHISFPVHFFDRFEQEFNVCFVEPDDDFTFDSWQDKWREEDEG